MRMPCCGRLLKPHEAADGSTVPPAPGDLTVCAGCGAVLVFDEGCRLRLPFEGELAALSAEEASALSAAMREVERRRRDG